MLPELADQNFENMESDEVSQDKQNIDADEKDAGEDYVVSNLPEHFVCCI